MADDMSKAVIDHARNDLNGQIPGRIQPAPEAKQTAPKLGEGHAMAMLRLGAHELTQALAAFPDSNIKPMEEPGTVGNPTPQIVTQEMGEYGAAAKDSLAAYRPQETEYNPAQYARGQSKDQEKGRSR